VTRTPLDEMYEIFATYKFGLSPRGNGLDCHRTWEMLFFGMIPIVKTGPLDYLYENLPVLVLNEGDDLCKPNILENFYQQWEGQLPVDDEKLTMGYYLEKARKHKPDLSRYEEFAAAAVKKK